MGARRKKSVSVVDVYRLPEGCCEGEPRAWMVWTGRWAPDLHSVHLRLDVAVGVAERIVDTGVRAWVQETAAEDSGAT